MITFLGRISFSWSSINALVCGLAVDVWFSYPRYQNLYKLVSWPFHSLLLLNWCCLLPLVLFLHWVSIFFVRTQYYLSFCYIRNKQIYVRFAVFLPVRLVAATGADTKFISLLFGYPSSYVYYRFFIWILLVCGQIERIHLFTQASLPTSIHVRKITKGNPLLITAL